MMLLLLEVMPQAPPLMPSCATKHSIPPLHAPLIPPVPVVLMEQQW
jgi:hypothetical protein